MKASWKTVLLSCLSMALAAMLFCAGTTTVRAEEVPASEPDVKLVAEDEPGEASEEGSELDVAGEEAPAAEVLAEDATEALRADAPLDGEELRCSCSWASARSRRARPCASARSSEHQA